MTSATREAEVKRYCDRCGAKLRADSSYCPKCGSEQVAVPTLPMDWRDPRLERKTQVREQWYERLGARLGGLMIAGVIAIAALGFFFHRLPWEAFLGSLVTLIGAWSGYLWFVRRRQASTQPL